jgi:TPR repeat protein
VTQDYAEAANWLRKAADQGDADAQYERGLLYSQGRGVTQNYAEAAKWYRKAAEQGNDPAQYELGLLYNGGATTLWFMAEKGDAKAQYEYGHYYSEARNYTEAAVVTAPGASHGLAIGAGGGRGLIGARTGECDGHQRASYMHTAGPRRPRHLAASVGARSSGRWRSLLAQAGYRHWPS